MTEQNEAFRAANEAALKRLTEANEAARAAHEAELEHLSVENNAACIALEAELESLREEHEAKRQRVEDDRVADEQRAHEKFQDKWQRWNKLY